MGFPRTGSWPIPGTAGSPTGGLFWRGIASGLPQRGGSAWMASSPTRRATKSGRKSIYFLVMPSPEQLSDRELRVLEAVVQTYIETAEPAGSQTIARRYGLGV